MYILKNAPKEDSEAAQRGSAVHVALESIINSKLAGEAPKPYDLLMKEALAKHPVRRHDTFLFVGQAIKLFLDDPLKAINPEKVVGIEEELAVDHNYEPIPYDAPPEQVAVRGKADVLMIDGSIATLIDHKTQMFVGDEDNQSFQMALYALLVLCTYSYITEVRTIIHYAAPMLNFYSRPAIWRREDLEDFKVFLEQRIGMAETIDVNNLEAIPGKYCQYCSVINDCPMKAEIENERIAKPGPIVSADMALDYAKASLYMDERAKGVDEYLKDYVKNIGPIPVGDSVFEMRTYQGRSYTKPLLILDALKRHGINTDSYIKVDSGALAELMDNPAIKPELKAELDKLTYSKPTSKVSAYKQKKGAR
jgi:hypothetical protein